MTADKLIKSHLDDFIVSLPLQDCSLIEHLMVEFAKYHVEESLKEASEKSYAYGEGSSLTTKDNCFYWTFGGNLGKIIMKKESVLNAYPKENIK